MGLGLDALGAVPGGGAAAKGLGAAERGLAAQATESALRGWQSERFQFDNQQFLLDKKGMKHILTRHHPAYWDGSVKAQQSFFDRSMSLEDVQGAIGFVMRQNRIRSYSVEDEACIISKEMRTAWITYSE